MKNFRTTVDIKLSSTDINYTSKLMFIGSCFADNIGQKFQEYKFHTYVNPFGVLYNPLSIKNSLELVMDPREFTKDDLTFYNDQWVSFYHHSQFSSDDQSVCLENINSRLFAAHDHLNESSYLFITLGTSFVYELKKTGKVVSNCHKLPAKEFNRSRLSVTKIVDELSALLNELKEFNPNLNMLFTVSPIRHWKDGAIDNQVSKSALILAVNELKEKFDFVDYFPAYEIMMDDLRDYRFYAADMLHPNEVATKYIWDKVVEVYVQSSAQDIMKKIEKINSAKSHRPFNPKSEKHQVFLKDQLKSIEALEKEHEELDLGEEVQYFENQLAGSIA